MFLARKLRNTSTSAPSIRCLCWAAALDSSDITWTRSAWNKDSTDIPGMISREFFSSFFWIYLSNSFKIIKFSHLSLQIRHARTVQQLNWHQHAKINSIRLRRRITTTFWNAFKCKSRAHKLNFIQNFNRLIVGWRHTKRHLLRKDVRKSLNCSEKLMFLHWS